MVKRFLSKPHAVVFIGLFVLAAIAAEQVSRRSRRTPPKQPSVTPLPDHAEKPQQARENAIAHVRLREQTGIFMRCKIDEAESRATVWVGDSFHSLPFQARETGLRFVSVVLETSPTGAESPQVFLRDVRDDRLLGTFREDRLLLEVPPYESIHPPTSQAGRGD